MRPVGIGVVGLGRAFSLMLPTFVRDTRVRLVAAADPLAHARARFEHDFGAPAFDDVSALCAHPDVQVVYVASPHQLHADHVRIAAAAGRHVLVEKPMAITLQQCTDMIDAAKAAGVQLIVGPSHSFDAPIQRTRALIDTGRFGRVRMITAMNFTDFLYRPRRPEELDTAMGGGVIHSQATHQIDIVRLLGAGRVAQVVAHALDWDPARRTEGAYQALLAFEDGASASATYSGYAHFDSDVLMDGHGELGYPTRVQDYGAARRRLSQAAGAQAEAALKAARNYGGSLYEGPTVAALADSMVAAPAHEHFGHIVVSCEHADLVPMPTGVMIHGDDERHLDPIAPPVVPRKEVIDELCRVVLEAAPAVHSGEWARATTEVCLGILEASRTQRPVRMRHQIGFDGVTPS